MTSTLDGLDFTKSPRRARGRSCRHVHVGRPRGHENGDLTERVQITEKKRPGGARDHHRGNRRRQRLAAPARPPWRCFGAATSTRPGERDVRHLRAGRGKAATPRATAASPTACVAYADPGAIRRVSQAEALPGRHEGPRQGGTRLPGAEGERGQVQRGAAQAGHEPGHGGGQEVRRAGHRRVRRVRATWTFDAPVAGQPRPWPSYLVASAVPADFGLLVPSGASNEPAGQA